MAPRKRKSPGKQIEWTEADLDEMTRITPQDIEVAAEQWRNSAGALANLLDASPEEPPANANEDQPANPAV